MQINTFMFKLTEWTLHYIKNKDILLKNIEKIEEKKDRIYVTYRNKKSFFYICPQLNNLKEVLDELTKEIKEYQPVLVMLNSKNNFDVLIKNWNIFVDFHPMFLVIFSNPDSKLDTKWIIFPGTHNMIADSKSLKNGLKSMFETVEEVPESKIQEYD